MMQKHSRSVSLLPVIVSHTITGGTAQKQHKLLNWVSVLDDCLGAQARTSKRHEGILNDAKITVAD